MSARNKFFTLPDNLKTPGIVDVCADCNKKIDAAFVEAKKGLNEKAAEATRALVVNMKAELV